MDVDQLIRIIQRYFLTPLNNMPDAQIKLLETNHDQSVQDFQNAIGLLFPQGDPVFQGKAADAFADYIGHYLDAEEALSPYEGNELSERINTLFSKCNALLSQEEGIIKSIQSSDVWGTAGKTFVGAEVTAAPFEIGAPPDAPVAQIIVIAAVAIAIVGVSIAKQNQVHSLTDTLNQWVSDMQNLAQQPDPPGSELPKQPAEIRTDTPIDIEQIIAQSLNIQLPGNQQEANIDEQLWTEWESGNITEDEFDIAMDLHAQFPNLTLADLLALARAIASGRLSMNTVTNYLYRLCGGMPGIGNLLVNALANGDTQARALLDKIINEADTARGKNPGNAVGSQRVMAVLRMLGLDNVADIGQDIPGSDGDIVLKDGTGIEIGGVNKGSDPDKFATQLQKYLRAYKGKVQVYLEDDGSPAAQAAIQRAKKLVGAENVHTFSASDRMCV